MSKRIVKPGYFIAFEGGEGVGKTTQIKHLETWLLANGLPVLVTRQPGGSPLGAEIRKLVLEPRYAPVSPRAELLLYQADRAQHVDRVLRPALGNGTVVISDRCEISSAVYQGLCRGFGLAWTTRLSHFATDGLKPDLVILLDVPEDVGLQRIRTRSGDKLDRIEAETRAFHRKVRQGYLQLARKHPRQIAVIDSAQSEDEVKEAIRTLLQKRLGKRLP